MQVVFYTAKIQNWKQFTTLGLFVPTTKKLCFTLQRYKIESNSQPAFYTNNFVVVVFYTAKIQNWKQFTTVSLHTSLVRMLCFTLQRYKIESNSQHRCGKDISFSGCVLHCKDTKLKAIHNHFTLLVFLMRVVFYTAKIQNWKQFTTKLSVGIVFQPLCFTLQRYKIESNSQRLSSNILATSVVFYTAKIQNWKQFTTQRVGGLLWLRLCFTLQRYKIESNSQLPSSCHICSICCVLHCKDTKLKAIHNYSKEIKKIQKVVFYTAKIQNWKQFTTTNVFWELIFSCVLHCKDTKLKAIHNQSFCQ